MTKKPYLLLIVSLLTLSGCNFTSEEESEAPHDYIDERDYEYQNMLVKPSDKIKNIDDFKAISDYYAFYKINKFTVNVSEYTFATSNKDLQQEMNYLYWHGELVNGVMGMTAKAKSRTTWEIRYIFYQNAFIDARETYPNMKDGFYQEPTSDRSETYNDFATEDASKPLCDVGTTQQLWYAAEHGYRLNPIPNSPAEEYYNKAKTLLRTIIKDDMDDYQKISTIYDYIEHHATYCYEALDAMDAPDPVNFPDEVCAQYKAFFLEGFFDNHTVVCDGYSKVMTLLTRMEGIETVRGSGTSDKRYVSKEVAGHAFCYVPVNNVYYLACPTWGQKIIRNKTITHKNYFMAPISRISPYQDTGWKEFTYTTSMNNKRYFQETKFTYNNTEYDLYIENMTELNAVLNYLSTINGTVYGNVYVGDAVLGDRFPVTDFILTYSPDEKEMIIYRMG